MKKLLLPILIGFLILQACDKEPKYDYTGSYSGTMIETEMIQTGFGDSTIITTTDEIKEVLREGDYLYIKGVEKSLISISTADHPVIQFGYYGYLGPDANYLSIDIIMNRTDLILDIEQGLYPYITNQHFEGIKIE